MKEKQPSERSLSIKRGLKAEVQKNLYDSIPCGRSAGSLADNRSVYEPISVEVQVPEGYTVII